ncbi:MAG: sulfotransferase domain-containing protein [Deinococcales bacterium]
MTNMIQKVYFIICGTQKGGTTALDSYLRQHPHICMGKRKELHFFDQEKNFQSDICDYTSYHKLFQVTSQRQILGEATPIYMYWRAAPQRMWGYNPKLKLIVILRNPIERAYSHWNMERSREQRASHSGKPFRQKLNVAKRLCPINIGSIPIWIGAFI